MDTCSTGSSTGSNFRELDVEFLQTQAKIWLEQVLDKRFDDEDTVADLLADGELLFQVSKLVGELMQRKFGREIESPVSFPEATTVYGKHGGKYLPYSNVDAFLKVCQKLGLTGVDLFSPPDVVEKRDIRRVCLCIRALSKKAQSKHLNVPDFDVVTHTLAMPTGMVGGIRKYLEQTRYSSTSDSSYSPSPDSRERLGKNLEPFCTRPFELSAEDPDEAESKLKLPEFESPGSPWEENTEATMVNLLASPPRSPHFRNEGWSPTSSPTGSSPIRNSITEINNVSTLVQSSSPSKDINGRCLLDDSRVIDTFTIDAVNGYVVKLVQPNTNEHVANSPHEELVNTSVVSASPFHAAGQEEVGFVDVDSANVPKADGVDIGCTTTGPSPMRNSITQITDLSTPLQSNAPSYGTIFNGSFDDESAVSDTVMTSTVNGYLENSALLDSNENFDSHEESVHTDAVSASISHCTKQEMDDVNVHCINASKTVTVDADPTNVPIEDGVDADPINASRADNVGMDSINVLKEDGVNVNYANVQADITANPANAQKGDTAAVDHDASIPKGDSQQPRGQKADSVEVHWADVLQADSVEVGSMDVLKTGSVEVNGVNVLKEVGVDIDYQYMPEPMQCVSSKSNFVDVDPPLIASESVKQHTGPITCSADVDHALIASETVNQLLSSKAGFEDVYYVETMSEKEMYQGTQDNEKDLPAEKFPPGKHNRRRLWMSFFASGLALLGTVIVVLRARKPEVYEIKKGDTLSQISRRVAKSSWKELVGLNPEIKNPDLIYPGDRLKLQ